MSTVDTIFKRVQNRRDMPTLAGNLIPVVDQAVRTIAKHLYMLGSSIIRARMTVPIYAEVSYTASLAFNGTAGTITDALSGFVTEGFDSDMPITTTHATNTGPFHVETAIAGTLTCASTDTITTATASSITVTSDDSYGFLPSDFWGLADKPYLDGKTWPLLPLPSVDADLSYSGAGDPVYYRVMGTKIYVTPHTASDYDIIADYFQRPTEITTTTATLPFYELFDDLIAEYAEQYFRGMGREHGGISIAALEKLVRDNVDAVAARYDRKAPPGLAQGIAWDFL